jgi:predicted RNA-binding Zn-ribbon protein involved in translation (DUF1610 family)
MTELSDEECLKHPIITADGETVYPGNRVFNYYDGEWGNIEKKAPTYSQSSVEGSEKDPWFSVNGTLLNGDRICTYVPEEHKKNQDPYKEVFGMTTTASAVVCPICGGPTHVNRDSGDFTCDHCGKMVVRANNNWVGSPFDVIASFNVDSFVAEAVQKEIKNFMKEMTGLGWIMDQTRSGHYKATWPHAPAGEKIEFFASTPSDPRASKNIRARFERKMKQYPAPDNNVEEDQE